MEFAQAQGGGTFPVSPPNVLNLPELMENAVNVNDYLIDHAGFDWQALLAGWAEILPQTFEIWLVNRFGDVFIIADDGSVHHLDVAVGTLDRLGRRKRRKRLCCIRAVRRRAWLVS